MTLTAGGPGAGWVRIDAWRLRLGARASAHLDLMRGLAAMLVMLGHVRGLFFVSWQHVSYHRPLVAPLYVITSWGHQSVMVFFVLSGFFISASIFKAMAGGRWDPARYVIQRLTRLWVVLIPALLLCLLWDQLGAHIFAGTGVYSGVFDHRTVDTYSIQGADGLRALLGNTFFLQGIRVPAFGSDGPLWSLSYELWYYMLFPCLLFMLVTRRWKSAVACGLGAVTIGLLIGGNLRLYFLIWLLGVLVLLVPKIPVRQRLPRLGASLCGWTLAGTALFGSRFVHGGTRSDFLVAVGFAAGLFLVLSAFQRDAQDAEPHEHGSVRGFSGKLADFSYTLYLVHLPALFFLHALFVSRGVALWQPTLAHLVMGAAIASLVVGFAWGVSRVTEARTEQVRALAWAAWLAGTGHVQAAWRKSERGLAVPSSSPE